jgi:hypothetical protein
MLNIKPQTIKKEFITLLQENNIPYNSVSVKKDDAVYKIISVNWTKSGKIDIQYSSMLGDYTDREVEAVLKHELCHYVSLPSAKIATDEAPYSLNVRYFLVYREYLAHMEFRERFGLDEGLKSYQKKLFMQYFDYLLGGSRHLLKNPGEKLFDVVISSVFSMLYTAMYYFVFEDDTFKEWCDKNNISNFHLLFSWIYEDMKSFHGMDIDQREREQMIQLAAELPLSIDYTRLLLDNSLFFRGKILEEGRGPGELSGHWKNRLEEQGAEFF